jgi:hypothetical protein
VPILCLQMVQAEAGTAPGLELWPELYGAAGNVPSPLPNNGYTDLENRRMSTEGVALLSRVALVAVLIITTAFVRGLIGSSKRRGLFMGIGTLGGMATGVAVASLMSPWIATDLSVVCACLGIFAGWIVAWRFAHRIPREAH